MLYKPIPCYRIFITAFLAALFLFSNPAFAQEIKNIRFGQPEDQVYRIVIETDRDTDFQFHIADHPQRLVVTIPSTSFPDNGLPPVKTVPPFHSFDGGNVSAADDNITFSFDGYLHVKSGFVIQKQGDAQNYKIVIDLEKVSAELFAAAVNSRWHRDKAWGDRAERVIPAFSAAPDSVVRQKPSAGKWQAYTEAEGRFGKRKLGETAAVIPLAQSDDTLTTTLPENNFSGPYAGLTLGYVSGKDKNIEFFGGAQNGWTTETAPNSALIGLVGGYNILQAHNFILGFEVDFELRDGNDSAVYLFNGVPDPTYPIKASLRQAASLRARFGYLFNDQQTMAFLSAGIATAKIERTYLQTAPFASFSSSDWQSGWVTGFGAEHRLTKKTSFVIEGRYADYGSDIINTAPIWGAGFSEKQTYTEKSLRIGSLFRF